MMDTSIGAAAEAACTKAQCLRAQALGDLVLSALAGVRVGFAVGTPEILNDRLLLGIAEAYDQQALAHRQVPTIEGRARAAEPRTRD